MLQTACLWAVLAFFPDVLAPHDPVAYQFGKATLEGKDVKLPMLRAHAPGRWLHAAGDRRFFVNGNTVTEVDPVTGKDLWTVTNREAITLYWKGAGKGIAHFLARSGQEPPDNTRTIVYRLDLNQRKWLPPLQFGVTDKSKAGTLSEPSEKEQRPAYPHYTVDVLVDDGDCILLTYILDRERDQTYPDLEQRAILGKQVTCYRTGETQPAWIRYFPWVGNKTLWYCSGFPNEKRTMTTAMRYLTWNGEHMILVLADYAQPLQSLQRSTGDVSWTVERLWEYERMMHGPKGGYWVTRFGLPTLFFDPEEGKKYRDKAEKEARTAFEKDHVAWIVAGPVVVDSKQWRRIFVVTNSLSHDQRRRWPHNAQNNLRLYELSWGGDVLAQTSFAMELLPESFHAAPEGISWACRRCGLVQFAPFVSEHEWSEPRSSIRWYRELSQQRREAWLSNGPPHDVGAFSARHYFLAHEPGFFAKQDEQVYRLPISVVDLETCQERTFMVAIPYKGKMSLPKINVISNGQSTRAAFGFMYLSVKTLQVDGNLLRVTLGRGGDEPVATMEFDLSSLAPRQ